MKKLITGEEIGLKKINMQFCVEFFGSILAFSPLQKKKQTKMEKKKKKTNQKPTFGCRYVEGFLLWLPQNA